MTNFTPQQLLTVAQRVMPQDDFMWYIRDDGTVEREDWTQSGYTRFAPETNHEQWRALAEFCFHSEINFHKGVVSIFEEELPYYTRLAPNIGINSVHAYGEYTDILGGRVEAFNLTDCMIAAVLALEEQEDG